MASTTYTVIITHTDDENSAGITAQFQGVGDSDEDKASIAFGLRYVADMIDDGETHRSFTVH